MTPREHALLNAATDAARMLNAVAKVCDMPPTTLAIYTNLMAALKAYRVTPQPFAERMN